MAEIPDSYKEVDQLLWVVSDLQRTVNGYSELGFNQVNQLGNTVVISEQKHDESGIKLAVANLGGAHVNWVEPVDKGSVFSEFLIKHGEGAMALIHRFPDEQSAHNEVKRLQTLGIGILEDMTIEVDGEEVSYILMDTGDKGKYVLGFTWGIKRGHAFSGLETQNRHSMKLNQYAFAIRDPDPVSEFWSSIGLPELEINHPELGNPMYYGKSTDHELIQGWQRHGSIAFEWCIPVKPPIVYEDHIKLHGEGIHHLAFSVQEMDPVLEDFRARGFTVSMGGTWGEEGKPGSGRYEYIDLEQVGGLTMELLWNYREE